MNNKSNTIMANSSVSSKRSFGDGTASSRSIQRSKKSFGDGTASSRSIQRSETPSPPSSPRKSGRQRDDSDAMRGDKSHLPSLIKNSASSSSIQKRDYDDDVEMLELEHDVFRYGYYVAKSFKYLLSIIIAF